jgi:hypothetical protein
VRCAVLKILQPPEAKNDRRVLECNPSLKSSGNPSGRSNEIMRPKRKAKVKRKTKGKRKAK